METTPYLVRNSSENLVILENGNVRSIPLAFGDSWTIGRYIPGNEPNIGLNSTIVSREHGRLEKKNGDWYYVEHGSLNGTYFNGKKIKCERHCESEPVLLQNGDILRIDSTDLDTPEDRGVWMLFSTESIGNQWKTVTLKKKETSFGRDGEICDIELAQPYISAKHMVVRRKENGFYVMDCDSSSGTWLNGQSIHGEVKLKEKDMISVCDCTIIFTQNKIIYNVPRKNKVLFFGKKVADSLDNEMFEGIQDEVKDNNFDLITNNVVETEANEITEVGQYDVDESCSNLMFSENGRTILKANIETRMVPNREGTGKKELIRDVRLSFKEGTLTALLGGAGAGKSTVMNCLDGAEYAGMIGKVELNGVDLVKNYERIKYQIGIVEQKEVFHDSLKVEMELAHAAKRKLPKDTKKSEIRERVNETLNQLGIFNVRKNLISKCSGGERRRVHIGIELVADRPMLFLDEPDAGLDPGNKRNLFETLQKLAHEGGKTVIAIIHDVSDIELFDNVIIMNKVDNVGRLAYIGTPQGAKEHFGCDIKDVYQLMGENPGKYVWEYK